MSAQKDQAKNLPGLGEMEPTWMTHEFLAECLRKKYGEVKIRGSSCEAAVPIGSNFCSDLFRVSVSFCKDNGPIQKISIIIKNEPLDELLGEITRSMNLFRKEVKMYTEFLPKMAQLLNITEDKDKFYPECLLGINSDEKSLLVLEDLKPLRYKVHSVWPGLDFEHCKLSVAALAKYHALGFLLMNENPSLKDLYQKGIYDEPTKPWVIRGLESVANLCQKTPELQQYQSKILKFKNKLDEDYLERLYGQNDFKLLLHGDMWTNNIMFGYDSNDKVKNVKLIDFQIVYYGNQAFDLHYFLMVAPNLSTRKTVIPKLLDSYYEEFVRNLKNAASKSNLTIPTKEKFLENYRKTSFFGLMTAVTSVVLILGSIEGKDPTYINLMKSDETPGSFRYHCYNNPHYVAYMKEMLPFIDDLGAFE